MNLQTVGAEVFYKDSGDLCTLRCPTRLPKCCIAPKKLVQERSSTNQPFPIDVKRNGEVINKPKISQNPYQKKKSANILDVNRNDF